MKPIDETYRDLADRAADQAESIGNQMTAIIDREDDEGNDFDGWMVGVRKEPDGRTVLVFCDRDVTNGRTVVYVDAILALADLIRRERVVESPA